MGFERRTELLANASRCFKEGYSPFCHEELSKMQVTSDECMDLSTLIGSIIKTHISEELEKDPIKRYIKSLTKSALQLDKTKDQAAFFGMDHVDLSMPQLTLVVKLTDSMRQNFGFLINFVRLDTLRKITEEGKSPDCAELRRPE